MPPLAPTTGLTVTNPLVLYRALVATKRINPDPAQHRLAIHLQKVYNRLLDYKPEVEYGHRIQQLRSSFDRREQNANAKIDGKPGRKGIFESIKAQKEAAAALALTRMLTDHEAASVLNSPKGLLLYGEVGTGKSMLVDLLADSLPNKGKRRWHFNTFMLETFANLEQLRVSSLGKATEPSRSAEYSILCLARDLISTSPILFLDEFQLPDRAASKILSNLFTSFFQLGGVLIATSNRMPEELAKASGVEFTPPPASPSGLLGKWRIFDDAQAGRQAENLFGGKGDFAAFLEVLRCRCEVFELEGSKDWRRHESYSSDKLHSIASISKDHDGFGGLEHLVAGNIGLGFEQSLYIEPQTGDAKEKTTSMAESRTPKHYFTSLGSSSDQAWSRAIAEAALQHKAAQSHTLADIWTSTSIRVYGRDVMVPRHSSGVTKWTFSELCCSNLGPADYLSLTSTFHTFILEDVPVLTLLHKNEARRLITLLDALYEARCKLLIRAAAGPDELFFPETQKVSTTSQGSIPTHNDDSVYSETFAEIFQDTTSPFRPNVSSYLASASPPSYPSSQARSMLADEDSDFGPIYGAGRRAHGPSDGIPGAGNEIGRQAGPDFGRVGIYTGEDERFAYKRAQSRLWELCSEKWWNKENWWKPLSPDVRRWERGAPSRPAARLSREPVEPGSVGQSDDEKLFRHGASPFRTSLEPPPKFSWSHAWGMMRWGQKAGAWGKGPEGLKDRVKAKDNGNDNTS